MFNSFLYVYQGMLTRKNVRFDQARCAKAPNWDGGFFQEPAQKEEKSFTLW